MIHRFFTTCLLVLISVCTMWAKGDKVPQYDIFGAGSGIEGTVLVKVYVYAKKPTDADLKRAAVHGVVFRGCEGNKSGVRQPAMASATAEADYAKFCESFFAADGACQNFASVVNGSYERVKTPKGYKVGAIIQVNKASLRKELEEVGIVRKLTLGF